MSTAQGKGEALPEPATWPLWDRTSPEQSEAGVLLSPYELLARYVSSEALGDLGDLLNVPVEDEDPGSDEEAARELVKSLYGRLTDQKLRYSLWPTIPRGGRYQQVRHPRWLLRDKCGTCLDLTVAFASMCYSHNLAPLIVIGQGHSMVAIVPGRGTKGWERPVELDGMVAGTFAGEATPGVLLPGENAERQLAALLGDGHLLVIETTSAVQRGDEGPTNFVDALERGSERLIQSLTWTYQSEPMRMVDAAWQRERHGRTVPAAAPPQADSESALRQFIEGDFDDTRGLANGQEALLQKLEGASGIHVIHGSGGVGKSEVARRLVARAKLGNGWFLNASSVTSLKSSLAAAELAQVNRTREGLDFADLEAYAESAKARLAKSNEPWIVAIDNANGRPDEIMKQIAPLAGDGRLLVVTTTGGEWRADWEQRVGGDCFHTLEGLAEDEVVDRLTKATDSGEEEGRRSPAIESPATDKVIKRLTDYVGGRWLLVDALVRLAKYLELSPVALAADANAPTGEDFLWDQVTRALADKPEILRAASWAAFLPPDSVDVSVLAEAHPNAPAALRAVGLLDWIPGEATGRLHRIWGGVIRNATDDHARAELAIELLTSSRGSETLRQSGEGEALGILLEALKGAGDEGGRATALADPRDRGSASVALGDALAQRGSSFMGQSGQAFGLALAALTDQDGNPIDDDLRDKVADAIVGSVRPTKDGVGNPTDLQLAEALGQAERATEIALGSRSRGRAMAMQGLLCRRLGRSEEALEMIQRADDLRRRDDSDTPEEELARSRFNFAGPHLKLALTSDSKDDARRHLDAAEKAYEEALELRTGFIAVVNHAHIAACEAGLALVLYFRVALLDLDPADRTEKLREATERALNSLRQREALAGLQEDDDVGKSARLLSKIMAARFRHSQHYSPAKGGGLGKLIVEMARELGELG